MAVSIQELEVVPPAPSQGGPASNQPQHGQSGSAAPKPELERQLERAARLRRSRDLRLEAD
ncbi:MAG TPA: hypothetical protein VMA77_09475 [Solirubrobacteraceae bacterium]|nr:hypothetical protein [Solirubrobacteraceae bacterium]